jgi:hypothetical protein
MPTSTPPRHSRRDFLRLSATIGTGLLSARSTSAAVPLTLAERNRSREGAPRTALSRRDIERAVNLAIDNVILEGLDDVFPRPFEIDALAEDAVLRRRVFHVAVARTSRMRFDPERFLPVQTIAIPKRTRREYRRCALIDPMDSIVYLALALLAAPAIERARPPVESGVALSHRFQPSDGLLYDRTLTYGYFARDARERLVRRGTNLLVTVDVQRFYDRVNHAWLGTCLERFAVDRAVTQYLLDILAFWAQRPGHGVPVGATASRILAEAVLTPVDWTLLDAGVVFTRFVDDYRLFAPDYATAETWLHRLTDELAAQGLYPNLAKTRISEATSELARNVADDAYSTTTTPPRSPTSKSTTTTLPGGGKSTSDKPPAARPKTKTPPKASDRYSSSIAPPTVPDADERARLGEVDLSALRAGLGPHRVAKPGAIRDFIMAAIYRNDDGSIRAIPEVVAAHPDFTGFASAALCLRSTDVAASTRRSVRRRFARRLLEDRELRPYETAQIVHLLGSDGYADVSTLAKYFRALDHGRQDYLSRVTVDALERLGFRFDVRETLEIRACGSWTRRALTRGVAGRPLAAAQRLGADRAGHCDPFLDRLLVGSLAQSC